jgi:hypothetical protein
MLLETLLRIFNMKFYDVVRIRIWDPKRFYALDRYAWDDSFSAHGSDTFSGEIFLLNCFDIY